jgi:MFS family permease
MMIAGTLSAFVFLGLVAFPYRFFLILFYFINGIATSIRQVTVAPFLMNHTSPEERQYVFSFNFGMVTTAGFVGNLLGGLLPGLVGRVAAVEATSTLAYQLTLGSMTVVGLLSVAPLLLIREAPRDDSYRPPMPWTLISRYGWQLAQLILPQFLIGLGAGLMQPFMNLYYRNVFQRTDAAIGVLFGLGSLSMGLAQFVAPPMADRFGKIKTVSVTQGISVPFLLLLGVAAWVVPGGHGDINTWFILAAVAFLIRLGLMNLSGPIYQTFVLEQVKPEMQALAISLNSMVSLFGWAFSPYLSGYFQVTYGEFGFVPIFFTTAALYVLGIGLLWAFFRHAEKQ